MNVLLVIHVKKLLCQNLLYDIRAMDDKLIAVGKLGIYSACNTSILVDCSFRH